MTTPQFCLRKIDLYRVAMLDANHIFAKAKRLFRTDVYTAKKDVVHGIRFLYFAIQLAVHKRIFDFQQGNAEWHQVCRLPRPHQIPFLALWPCGCCICVLSSVMCCTHCSLRVNYYCCCCCFFPLGWLYLFVFVSPESERMGCLWLFEGMVDSLPSDTAILRRMHRFPSDQRS